jgi:hypothetical protein
MIKPILSRVQSVRVVVLALTVVMLYGFLSFARIDATSSIKTTTVDLPGVTGADNTVAFAFDRFALIAPYASTQDVQENGDLSQLDNYSVSLIDLKKPGPPQSKVLTTVSAQPQTLYYPTKVVFDPVSSNVYVLGVTFTQTDEGLQSNDAIAYFHLNLDGGKPVLDASVVIVPIKDIAGSEFNSRVDFGISKDGRLVFTNGVTIFTFSIPEGYITETAMFPANQYSPDCRVSLLQVEPDSNIVTVCWNRKEKGDDGKVHETSELSVYALNEKGTLDLLKRSYAANFPNGSFLTQGSNVVVVSDADGPKQTMFVTSDGSLCQVNLREGTDLFGEIKVLGTFDELAQTTQGEPSPRILQYDPVRRVVGVVKQGFTAQISRPSNGRRGGISRPSNALLVVEQPSVTLIKFGKKDRISSAAFSGELAKEPGLTGLTQRSGSEWLFASYSGKLYSLTIQDDITASTVVAQGELGSRVGRIDYEPARDSVVAINSLLMDDSGATIAAPGSVVVGRFVDSGAASARFIQTFLPTGVLARSTVPSIRRPCNAK